MQIFGLDESRRGQGTLGLGPMLRGVRLPPIRPVSQIEPSLHDEDRQHDDDETAENQPILKADRAFVGLGERQKRIEIRHPVARPGRKGGRSIGTDRLRDGAAPR